MAETNLKLSKAKIRQHKRDLRKLKKNKDLSLQQMVDQYFSGTVITRQILGRFIKEKEYVPTSHEARTVLDLYRDPNPYRVLPKYFERSPEALAFYKHQGDLIRQASAAARQQFKEAKG